MMDGTERVGTMTANRWGIDPLPEEGAGLPAWTNWWFSNLGPVVVLVGWALIIHATTWIREKVTCSGATEAEG